MQTNGLMSGLGPDWWYTEFANWDLASHTVYWYVTCA
jgi:hypothetical protein